LKRLKLFGGVLTEKGRDNRQSLMKRENREPAQKKERLESIQKEEQKMLKMKKCDV